MTATVTPIRTARDRAELAAVLETMGLPACPNCGNNRQVWRNRVTGLLTCHRAYCHTVVQASEGTESARRINRPAQCASLTPEPLLLHRVDASQLQTPVRIVNGPVEQRQCRPGMCEGLPTCGDHVCQGHPGNDVRPEERDGPLLLKVVLAYGATLALCGWATWQWLAR